jgi:tRNA threonylcarbamoyladenosine biosynthesis protein TsaB
MTNILAIETSSVYCSIGLAKNKEIYIEHSQEENTHGKNIFGFIDSLLEKSQLEKEELDFIALSVGPGIFYRAKGRMFCSARPCIWFAKKNTTSV